MASCRFECSNAANVWHYIHKDQNARKQCSKNPIVTATPDIPVSAAETDDTVYITRTGKAYHRKNCMYAKDKDCIALSRAEAEKEYLPCKYCNP